MSKVMEHQLAKPYWLHQVESIFDAMSEGVAVLDAGRVLFVNEALLRMTGFQRQDMIGRMNTDFFALEDLPFIRQQIALREREGHVRFEYYLLSQTGAKVPTIISSRNFYGPDQHLFVIVTCADIREQKLSEARLRQANAQLQESEARKDAMMQSALDCIISIDHQGKIIEFNPAAEKNFGYTRAQVIGKELAATVVPPSLREAHRRGLAHYLATGQGPVLGKRIEIMAMHADGSEFPVELAIVPIHLGEHPIFTAYLRDITEPKRAEKELHEAKDAAIAANHAKSELLAELETRHDELEATLQQLKITQNKLEAENARKAHELEEARRLHLAMLPKDIPKLPHLEIGVFMQTASEVGGDYYDFHVNDEGALTVAIGDAIGHGLQAGTIVASTKSLFKALVDEPEPAQVLKKMSSALKAMGFRTMFMAMTVAKFDQHRLTLSAAGMPFTLVHRAATGNTEQVILKAMPLGSFPDFAYQQKILSLRPGDTVLFVSDGLHETFNAQEEMLGESRMIKLFTEIACRQPRMIVRHLAKAAKTWANGRALHDDMTILAVKMR
jgi:PAS domain S-box-containing protein